MDSANPTNLLNTDFILFYSLRVRAVVFLHRHSSHLYSTILSSAKSGGVGGIQAMTTPLASFNDGMEWNDSENSTKKTNGTQGEEGDRKSVV